MILEPRVHNGTYQHMEEGVLPTCGKQQDKDPPRSTTDMNWSSFTWSASDDRPENVISNSISISSRDSWPKKNIKELLEGRKQDPHVMGGLIFAAKCGENCLTVLVTFSLKVTAKLQSQTWEMVNNRCPDENYHFLSVYKNILRIWTRQLFILAYDV
jgi:hypothetical protein